MYNKSGNKRSKTISDKELRIATHDLNNLLHNIISGVELLKEKFTSNNSIYSVIKNIEKNTVLASELVQTLHPNRNTFVRLKQSINVNNLITDTVELFGKNFKSLVHIIGLNENLFIWGNFLDLKRALFNLLLNAEEASEFPGLIKISINQFNKGNPKKRYIKISVSDKGKGISAENVENIFEEGFSTKAMNGERGLGLSFVKEIVDEHQGTIDVKSSKSMGTNISLIFPQYIKAEVNNKLETTKVIIAEDDEFQREVLKDLLKSLKLNVFTAANGIEALDLYQVTKPDLLFIDDQMPGMSGIECTKKIKELNQNTKVVLVTGSSVKPDLDNTNIVKIIQKPYSFDIVESTIRELL